MIQEPPWLRGARYFHLTSDPHRLSDILITIMRTGQVNGSESRRAKFPLKFVIVGASVAGLSCAYALQQAGHSCHVLEASEELGWVCRALIIIVNAGKPISLFRVQVEYGYLQTCRGSWRLGGSVAKWRSWLVDGVQRLSSTQVSFQRALFLMVMLTPILE